MAVPPGTEANASDRPETTIEPTHAPPAPGEQPDPEHEARGDQGDPDAREMEPLRRPVGRVRELRCDPEPAELRREREPGQLGDQKSRSKELQAGQDDDPERAPAVFRGSGLSVIRSRL